MKKRIKLTIVALMCLMINGYNMNEKEIIGNPILNNSNTSVHFDQITDVYVKQATDSTIESMNNGLKKIYSISPEKRTFENSIQSFDLLYDKLNSVQSIIYLMAYVNPDSAVRAQSEEGVSKISKYINEITLDEKLYKVFTEYAETEEAKTILPEYKKLLKEQIDDFNRNGFKLPEDQRKILKEIKDKLSDLTLKFSTNINEYDDFLIIAADDTAGLPHDYLESRKQENGTYKIDLSYPSYRPFMKYASNEENRKALQFKYLNRAAEKNLEILKSILIERQKMAKLLGYETYASYALENKMAKNPKTVWDFENGLIDKVKEKAIIDYQELLDVKDSIKHEKADTIYTWESGYYNNILLKDKYQLDQEKLKEYFTLDSVLNGIFTIAQKLYNVKFSEIENPPVWHKEVKMYEIIDQNNVVGYFYLDLHPRDNKYNHAACFSLVNGVKNDKLKQIPSAALICNFPRATSAKPSLINHSDVITMFHEFGHLMHHLSAVTSLSMQSGISNSRDFVEVPSQFFENWAWSYESLKLFAFHYKTGDVLPEDFYKKMIDSKNVGSGLFNLQQIFYGEVDMTLHDKYNPNGSETTSDVVKKLQNTITLYPYTEGTHFEAAFGHLTNYAAGYYGYLWAEVYSEDCFSLFEKYGILNQKIGERFKNEILSKGSTKDEMDLIKAFLQREPNDEAFVKSLGLK